MFVVRGPAVTALPDARHRTTPGTAARCCTKPDCSLASPATTNIRSGPILHSELFGLSRHELMLVALVARYHRRASETDALSTLQRSTEKNEDRQQARVDPPASPSHSTVLQPANPRIHLQRREEPTDCRDPRRRRPVSRTDHAASDRPDVRGDVRHVRPAATLAVVSSDVSTFGMNP